MIKNLKKRPSRRGRDIAEAARSFATRLPFVPIPVLVYQMGKVGSSTIYYTLKENGIPATHVHVLLPSNLDWVRKDCAAKGVPAPDDRFRRAVADQIQKRRKKVRIITLVRDPVSQNFSSFFQNFERESGKKVRKGEQTNFNVDEIVEQYRRDYPKATAIGFFDNELGASTGIDVYRSPFPHKNGYQIIEEGPISLLILRVDAPDSDKVRAINEFLGTQIQELKQKNISSEKAYSDLYAQFKKKLKLPRTILSELLDSKYCGHFFTDEEREDLLERWAEE